MQSNPIRPSASHFSCRLLSIGILLVSGTVVEATELPCEAHYQQEGSFIAGRQFKTWDVIADVAVDTAFKRITVEGVKSGLTVAHSDVGLGILTFSQANAGVTNTGQHVNLPWNVAIEVEGTGSRITVSKTTPGGYATSQDFQISSMCAVIDAARNP